MAVFPNFKPSSASKTSFHEIEPNGIKTQEDLNRLIDMMFYYQERKFYILQFINKNNPIIDRAINDNLLIIKKTEFMYFNYKTVGFKPSFRKILEYDKYKFLEHGEIISNELTRSELKLTDYCKRELDFNLRKNLNKDIESRKPLWAKVTEPISISLIFISINMNKILQALLYIWKLYKDP